MPQYKKVFDIGTYTGNGGQYRVGIPTLRMQGPSAGTVAQSLRFRASNSNYLTRTPASSGNRKIWTFSCWFKKTANGGNVSLFSTYGSSSDTTAGGIVFGSSDQLYFMAWGTIWRRTTLAFKDSSKWYHLVIAFDTTQAAAANRIKMYIDGKQIDSFAASTDPSLNTDYGFNTNNHHEFGAWIPTATSGYSYLDMYLAETYFLDGYAYDASYFGEFNSDGIWVPKAYTGSYGTNGFNLKFAPGAAGTDSSGNGNTWTLSGFNVTTSNTTYDIVSDSPVDYLAGSMTTANNAGNYCVWNPLASTSYLVNGSCTITNGALTVGDGATTYGLHGHGTLAVSSGKWYWEITCTSIGGNYGAIGIVNMNTLRTGGSTNDGYYYISVGGKYDTQPVQYSLTYSGAASYTTGDIIGVAMDLDSGTLTFYKNGVSQGALPVTITAGNYTPAVGDGQNATTYSYTLNAGQRAFSYTPPSGYKALNTYNIARPADSSMWFYGDTPDFMWIKNRSTSSSHILQDTVKGIALSIFSTDSAVENGYPYVMEMNKFGMSLQLGTGVNGSGNGFVYWAWKAGSNTSTTSVTNTSGSITSQVSANPSAGFSIVSYTGTGANATVGHGLGAAPSMVIVKRRNVIGNWPVYHSAHNSGSSPASYVTYLNLSNSQGTAQSGSWNSTSPTSTVFSLGNDTDTNQSGTNYIGYCWSAIPGYSAFGSWTGNGSADGPFIYLGFRPKMVLYKRSDAAGNDWTIHDSTRDYYNGYSVELYPSLTNAEGGPYSPPVFDFLSNGLKIRSGTASYTNTSGGAYIYAAFAEIPFKYARAR